MSSHPFQPKAKCSKSNDWSLVLAKSHTSWPKTFHFPVQIFIFYFYRYSMGNRLLFGPSNHSYQPKAKLIQNDKLNRILFDPRSYASQSKTIIAYFYRYSSINRLLFGLGKHFFFWTSSNFNSPRNTVFHSELLELIAAHDLGESYELPKFIEHD